MSDTPEVAGQRTAEHESIEKILARIGITPNAEDNLEKFFLLFVMHGQKKAEKEVREGRRPPGLVLGFSKDDLEAAIYDLMEAAESGDPLEITVNITPSGIAFAAMTGKEFAEVRARRSQSANDAGEGNHGPH